MCGTLLLGTLWSDWSRGALATASSFEACCLLCVQSSACLRAAYWGGSCRLFQTASSATWQITGATSAAGEPSS
jgi:hypothetical protein